MSGTGGKDRQDSGAVDGGAIDVEPEVWVLSAGAETSTREERDALLTVWRPIAERPDRLIIASPDQVELYGTGTSRDGLAAAAEAGAVWPMAGMGLRRHRGRAALRHAARAAAGLDGGARPDPDAAAKLTKAFATAVAGCPELDPLLVRLARLVADVGARTARLEDQVTASQSPLAHVMLNRLVDELVGGAVEGYLGAYAAELPLPGTTSPGRDATSPARSDAAASRAPEPPPAEPYDPAASLAALRELGERADRRRAREVEKLIDGLPALGPSGRNLLDSFSRRLVAVVLAEPAAALRSDADGSAAEAARKLFGVDGASQPIEGTGSAKARHEERAFATASAEEADGSERPVAVPMGEAVAEPR